MNFFETRTIELLPGRVRVTNFNGDVQEFTGEVAADLKRRIIWQIKQIAAVERLSQDKAAERKDMEAQGQQSLLEIKGE